ncbi:hypothetical protein [Cellvibrio sp. PSBB023]|uniref:hypothetical protein n=1 Tax=Cellvibrio sp. PSBB023 TaxID=1945512 RepID=UPI001FEE515D|nr:hypothetical protein [Cellvibrio sp. PSBB023]
MTNLFPAADAAAILVERRIQGTQGDALPVACRPQNLEQALAIQAAVTERWCEQMDDSIGGWKCLLPPEGKLVIGPIYTRTIDSVAPVSLWTKTSPRVNARVSSRSWLSSSARISPRDPNPIRQKRWMPPSPAPTWHWS